MKTKVKHTAAEHCPDCCRYHTVTTEMKPTYTIDIWDKSLGAHPDDRCLVGDSMDIELDFEINGMSVSVVNAVKLTRVT